MVSGKPIESTAKASARGGEPPPNSFAAADVTALLRVRGWLTSAVPTESACALSPYAFRAAGASAPPRLGPNSWNGASSPSLTALASGPPERRGGAGEDGALDPELEGWLADAAALLGPHAADRETLAELLALIFQYDACAILQSPESHAVLTREGAREVIRELAHLVLEGPEIDSDRFKEIVTALKGRLRLRGRELFHPIRLALAGRAGEGALDRVVLLLDRAARLPFRVRVKSARQRMLEFCAAME